MNSRKPLNQILALGATLGLLWLLLSGHYTPLLLSLGLISVMSCVWIAVHMGIVDEEMHHRQFKLYAVVLYGFWLMKEIVLACLDVSRRILDPKLPISPVLVQLPVSQQSDMGRTIFANSITLTPGTIAVDLGDQTVQVHALTRAAAEGLATGEMDRRVSALERQN